MAGMLPLGAVVIQRTADGYDLLVYGTMEIRGESFAVVDQVREACYGHRAGVVGELRTVADVLIEKYARVTRG
jgi:hypothetical protein